MVLGQPRVRREAAGDAWRENGGVAVAGIPAHPAEAVARVGASAEMGRAGIEGGGAGSAGSKGRCLGATRGRWPLAKVLRERTTVSLECG